MLCKHQRHHRRVFKWRQWTADEQEVNPNRQTQAKFQVLCLFYRMLKNRRRETKVNFQVLRVVTSKGEKLKEAHTKAEVETDERSNYLKVWGK